MAAAWRHEHEHRLRADKKYASGRHCLTSPEPAPNRAATPGRTRPSLTAAHGVQEDRLSILASLEGHERKPLARPASSGKTRWVIGSFLLVAVAAAYVYVRADDVSAPRPEAVKLAVSTRSVTNSPLATKAAAVNEAASEPVAASASAPARIEVIEAPAARASDAGSGDPFASLGAAAAASAVSMSNAASTPSVPASAPATNTPVLASAAPASVPVHKQTPHPTAKAAKHPAKQNQHGRALASASHKAVTRDAVKPAKDSGGRDPDVDLLAALMAHVANTGDGKTGRSHDRSRIPVDEPSIAKLVKRCEVLSGEEAVQCQKRICDGYWGKAQACPARSDTRRE
jgi:hypothetical protein